MEHYPSLAMPTSRTREKNSIFDQKWNHISEDINKIKWGCVKTGPEWQRVCYLSKLHMKSIN